MLKIICDVQNRHGWHRSEENFTGEEARTAVEIAREREGQPDKYRNVKVLDLRPATFKLVTVKKADDAVIHKPEVVSEKGKKLPACKWLDLSKLPRVAKKKASPARLRVLGVVATVEQFTPKAPRRVSKRERAFGNDANKREVASL